MVQMNFGDDSDADLQGLCSTEADKTSKDKPRARLEQSDGGNDPMLSEIAEDLLNVDETGPAAEKQLADFICGVRNCPTQNLRITRRNIYARRIASLSQHRRLTLKSGINWATQ